MKATAVVAEDPIPLSPRTRFRAAMILAMAADALQIFVFPLFAEGALSPADDVLDIAVAAVLAHLLGWHWDVYRKWKQITITTEESREQHPALRDPQGS
ncbi:MAG: hypothetical protein DMG75_14735 [Acidobacteria bacterium]|nr:MAG: hypothetical protein DMG75_14735 [Acidobacteriota bacterium]